MQKPLKGYWVSHCKPAISNNLMNISSKVNTILYFSFSDMTAHITKPLPLSVPQWLDPHVQRRILSPHWKARQSITGIPQWLDSHFSEWYWTPIAKLGRVHLPKNILTLVRKLNLWKHPFLDQAHERHYPTVFISHEKKWNCLFFAQIIKFLHKPA